MKNFIKYLKENNVEFKANGKKTTVLGGNVYLRSLTSMPDNVEFNNGGNVYLKNETVQINKDYLTRFGIEVKKDKVILYKRVSKKLKTQEGTDHETYWGIGKTLTHPAWNPTEQECGAGKFHACARPHWCDIFRSTKGDKYIAIQIKVEDLFEWKSPSYPQKIGFRKGKVLKTVKRLIK